MHRFGAFLLRHRALTALVWLAVAVIGVLIAPQLSGRLQSGTTLHSATYTANQTMQSQYGGVAANPSVLVVDLPAGTHAGDPQTTAALAAADHVAQSVPGVHDISYASTHDASLVGNNGSSTLVLVYPPTAGNAVDQPVMDQMAAAVTHDLPGAHVSQTGYEQLSAGNASSSSGGSSVGTEILIGGGLALLVLVWVFGSALAFLPLLSAAVSVLTMQIAIWGLTYATSIHINPAVQFIVALLGLGLSIDYSLLLVNRWREERDAGSDNRTAVLASMRKAGHSVAFSGTVASLGLFALIVVPISFLQGVGLSGLFIPSIAAVTALTTVPLLLDRFGPGLDRVRLRKRRIETEDAPKFWTKAARRIVRRPRIAAALGSAILIALSVLGLGININNAPAGNLANSGPAHDGLVAMQHDGFPTGILTPVPVLVPHGQDPASFAAGLRGLPDIHGVLTPTAAAWAHGGTSVVTVLPNTEIGTSAAGPALTEVHAHAPVGALVGGSQVQSADVAHQIGQYFPILLAVVALITFVLLARGMRSLLLPAKAVLLNVLSVGAAYGVLVLIWQHGIGSQSIWGVPATGSISAYVPMLLFGFLFGVSMDYEVFILARMREAYDRDGDTEKAVVEGIGRTGRLVTSAALILVLALTSLSMAPDPTVKMMGTGMAAGVLIDALVVRTLLTPALVVLFDRANWYLPRWAAKALLLKPDAHHSEPGVPETPARPEEELANSAQL